MSPRKRVLRKVLKPPIINGFKPYGQESEKRNLAPINILYEEYEAIRLSDYDTLNHHQASVMMGVSRPTFTRIYASALRKVAQAFVEGRQVAIKGGKVYFDSDWHHCHSCTCYFNNPEKDQVVEKCPLCGSTEHREYDYRSDETGHQQCNDFCVCPSCGFEQKHEYGVSCRQQKCPKCGIMMKRR